MKPPIEYRSRAGKNVLPKRIVNAAAARLAEIKRLGAERAKRFRAKKKAKREEKP